MVEPELVARKLSGIFPNVNLVAKKRAAKIQQKARECALTGEESSSNKSQLSGLISLPTRNNLGSDGQANSIARSEFEQGRKLNILAG
jgi:hypothetical protein